MHLTDSQRYYNITVRYSAQAGCLVSAQLQGLFIYAEFMEFMRKCTQRQAWGKYTVRFVPGGRSNAAPLVSLAKAGPTTIRIRQKGMQLN